MWLSGRMLVCHVQDAVLPHGASHLGVSKVERCRDVIESTDDALTVEGLRVQIYQIPIPSVCVCMCVCPSVSLCVHKRRKYLSRGETVRKLPRDFPAMG